jgi:5S rRNA maturation endonuclease (ribonuclease M5)
MDLQKIKNSLNEQSEEIFSKLGMKYEVLGDNIYCNCPVHEGSDNPRAFSFSKDKGIWKCWTRDCQQQYRNDIFGVIRGSLSKESGVEAEFSDALKWACDFLGIKKGRSSSQKPVIKEPVKEDDFNKLVNTINSSIKLDDNYPAIEIEECVKTPSQYFISRGFKPETLVHFDVGDCYDRGSKLYERSVVPIHNDTGDKVIACIARSIKEYRSPKFLLDPKGFDKRYFFYNYHRAIESVKQTSSLFLVEGQGDVWRLYEAGITQSMSIFGRSLSKEQELKLSKMPLTHIIVLLDNDQAGREAKVQLQRQLGRMYKLSFPKIPTKDVGEMRVEQIKNIIIPQVKGTING